MSTNQKWVDMTTAPRELVQSCFEQQRDEIMMRIIRFQGELESYNENRFADNPIILSMDFTEHLDKYLALDQDQKSRLYSRAFDTLMELETAD